MQQYQVDMIAQFDNYSDDSLLPMTPEQHYAQQQKGHAEHGDDLYQTLLSWDPLTSYGTEGSYAAGYSTPVTSEYSQDAYSHSGVSTTYSDTASVAGSADLICEEVSKVSMPSKQKKNVKRELCQFWVKGCCERGVTCTYAHGTHQIGEEITAAPIATCKWWVQGTCRVKKCKYAHFYTQAEGELFGDLATQEQAKLQAKGALKVKEIENKNNQVVAPVAVKVQPVEKVNNSQPLKKLPTQTTQKLTRSEKRQRKWEVQNAQKYNQQLQWGPESYNSVSTTASLSVKSGQSDFSQAARLSNGSNMSHNSAVPTQAINKPQTEAERQQLMALLGNVMAALQ